MIGAAVEQDHAYYFSPEFMVASMRFLSTCRVPISHFFWRGVSWAKYFGVYEL